MLPHLLFVHSWVRWLVVLNGIALGARLVAGWRSGRVWIDRDRAWTLAFAAVFSLQILVGILLYLVSPLPQAAFDMGALFLKNRVIRFYTIEHITMMVSAWFVFVAGGFAVHRGATERRMRRMGILVLVVMAMILASIPWPGLSHGRPLYRTWSSVHPG
jgi:hypothetical protein